MTTCKLICMTFDKQYYTLKDVQDFLRVKNMSVHTSKIKDSVENQYVIKLSFVKNIEENNNLIEFKIKEGCKIFLYQKTSKPKPKKINNPVQDLTIRFD